MNKKISYTATFLFVLIGVFLCTYGQVEAGGFGAAYVSSGGYSYSNQVGYPSLIASVSSGLKPNDTYSPGDQFTITASQTWNTSCNNQNFSISTSLYYINSGSILTTGTASYGAGCNGGWGTKEHPNGNPYSNTATVSYTYTAPSTPGDYYIAVTSGVSNTHTCGGDNLWSGSETQEIVYYFTVANPVIDGVCAYPDQQIYDLPQTINGAPWNTDPLTKWCSAGNPDRTNSSWTNNIFNWICKGSGVGAVDSNQCSMTFNANGVCGTATSVIGTSSPTTNLCENGGTPGGIATTPFWANTNATTPDYKWNWSCSGLGTGASATCQANFCSTGNKYCPDSKTCIPLGSCCDAGNAGGTSQGNTCSNNTTSCQNTTSNGLQCVSNVPVCSVPVFSNTISPKFVATANDTCKLTWNANSTDSNPYGTPPNACNTNMKCYLDGSSTALPINSSQSGLHVGTHTLTCTTLGGVTATYTGQCRTAPNFGEF